MSGYLLDTDHVSLEERGHEGLRARFAMVPPEEIAVSVVTVEEMLRGRLAILARRPAGEARVRAYAKLLETVNFFRSVRVVLFDMACERRFQELRRQRSARALPVGPAGADSAASPEPVEGEAAGPGS